MKFLKSSIARVWLEKIIFFEFVVIPIDSRQLLTEFFLSQGVPGEHYQSRGFGRWDQKMQPRPW